MSTGRRFYTFLSSAVGVSLLVHAILLGGLAFIRYQMAEEAEEFVLDSVMNEERIQEEYTQQLEMSNEVATTMNVVAGGSVTGAIGQAANPTAAAATVNIEPNELIKDPEVRVRVASTTRPGDGELAIDLGAGQVKGEIGAVVEGYGAALSRLTQELIRLMRKEKVLVVWLFDQSDSMKDDQKEIAGKFHKVYEELGLVLEKDEEIKKRASEEVLRTVVGAFGEKLSFPIEQPTTDAKKIQTAIESIPIDESGLENLCAAIALTTKKYHSMAARQERRLVIVVVSDESGDDGANIEAAIKAAQDADAPVYVLGREAVFGYPYARIRWQDPKYKLWHWLQIRRGPETGYPECLQWDGLHSRWDAFSSGFGPYEQVRLCRDTGGIFFILPGEEEDLTGAGAKEKRQFRALDMRRYTPMLLSRRDYAAERERSPFRKTIWQVIASLNPNKDAVEKGLMPMHDPKLNIREHWYPLEAGPFREQASKEVVKAARAMQLLNTAITLLEGARDLRAREDFDRWRANYDLALAQTRAYRVRLFQYLLAMDDHANNMPPVSNPKHNRWNVGRTRKMIEPDQAQFERLKTAFGIKMTREEYLAYVQAEVDTVNGLYDEVLAEHPGTPWARRAKYEKDHGFGMHFYSAYRDPNYDKLDIKLPKP